VTSAQVSKWEGVLMESESRLLTRLTAGLAVLSTAFLAFNMVGIPVYKEQVFFERGALSGVEMVIGIGFGLVLLFDVVSLLWVLLRLRQSKDGGIGDRATLVLGALCLVLFIGEKTMVDEIGQEYLLGWEVPGEWIILYVFLTIQLVYNLVLLVQLFRAHRGRRVVPGLG
jgi:hypothetical protein